MKQTLGELMTPGKDEREGRREKTLEARQLLVPYSGGLPALRPAEPVLRALGRLSVLPQLLPWEVLVSGRSCNIFTLTGAGELEIWVGRHALES